MAKTKEFTRTVELPVQRVYDVVSSTQYLTTTDGMLTETEAHIVSADREVAEDGEVRAQVTVSNHAPNPVEEPGAVGEAGGSGKAGAEADEGPELVTTQTTIVSVPESDGSFRMIANTPLPNAMGEMSTTFYFQPTSEESTQVQVQVMADVKIPIVGGTLAKKLLGSSEGTVDNGLARVVRLDEGWSE
ncbi:MAG TPA: DUF2505 family protein [Candidatus Corynebacterium gallistercoris]|uniref:DUF2505 family protein n=1 Tax=Candidatus Corynebacterium gallistercoris TaxID=2838530 RepID=A0A9D1RXM1_9CORY|nr:DUF2505 family protein [Candidatus Corynebacterium gallistercoris]